MFVFSDTFKEEVERDLLSVGHALMKQINIDLPKMHFTGGYLPDPKKGEDNSSGKNAHELRGVLLTVLCFLLQHGQLKILQNRIGDDWLGCFVKVMELTLLLESFLNKDEFTEEELKLFDKFVPYFMYTFTDTVKRTEGHGMKLIKIHLLHHFSLMIRLFGCAKIFDTFIPEKNHKTKVKQHARRTRFQSADFEYHTARKDYEDVVLYVAENEVLSIDSTSVIGKYVSVHNETNEAILEDMRNGVYFTVNFGNAFVFLNKRKQALEWKSHFLTKRSLLIFFKTTILMSSLVKHNTIAF